MSARVVPTADDVSQVDDTYATSRSFSLTCFQAGRSRTDMDTGKEERFGAGEHPSLTGNKFLWIVGDSCNDGFNNLVSTV